MEGKMLGPALSSLRLGLVRLTNEFTVVDKNSAADAVFPFPRRGGSIKSMLVSSSEKSSEQAYSVMLRNGSITKNAVAFREREGILLLLHPLLSALHFGKRDGRFSRVLSTYSLAIYEVIKQMEKDCEGCEYKMITLSERCFRQSPFSGDYHILGNAVLKLVNKVSAAMPRKNIALVIDNRCKKKAVGVRYSSVEYALGEIFAIREMYGLKEEAVIDIMAGDAHLDIVMHDRVESSSAAKGYIHIASEVIRLIELGCYSHISSDGELTFKVFIPYEKVNAVHESTVACDDYGYIDYCLDYLNIRRADSDK